MTETKELLLGLAAIGKFVADRAKDGLQLDDAVALIDAFKDPVFKARVDAAVKGIDKVPDEFKDFGLANAMELVGVLPELIAIVGVKA